MPSNDGIIDLVGVNTCILITKYLLFFFLIILAYRKQGNSWNTLKKHVENKTDEEVRRIITKQSKVFESCMFFSFSLVISRNILFFHFIFLANKENFPPNQQGSYIIEEKMTCEEVYSKLIELYL